MEKTHDKKIKKKKILKASKGHQSMAWSEELDRLRVVVTCDEKES